MNVSHVVEPAKNFEEKRNPEETFRVDKISSVTGGRNGSPATDSKSQSRRNS